MIAILEGVVSEKNIETVVLDVRGVGYGLYVTSEDNGVLATGRTQKLYVYEHIREAAHDLYGFCQKNTKELFEQLLNVNGVGPKMALNILSLGNVQTVADSIANEDVAFIKQATGVGKKVAERIVIELKDKVGVAGGVVISGKQAKQDEAVQGLMALGFTQDDAARALSGIDETLSTEERIKQALKETK
jgi:Holliday junction DNA helicase RuvA